MLTPTALIIFAILIAIALALVIVIFPGITRQAGGRILAFFPLFLLPIGAAFLGGYYHLENSKRTTFCLSCHTMTDHGKSLLIDDPNYLAAQHFQNQRVPRDEPCYTCHSDYTMYGDVTAKLRGLRHVYVYYLGKPPAKLHLYQPYNNRECLHCHEGARSFEEAATHNADPEILPALKSNRVSCLSCHDTVHAIDTLKDKKLWNPDENREEQ
jgi:cytochrome c-type protein NapC